ncbi:hypothetical protein COB11_05285 [Candidatus Aerophobetes bacterium]|uniref:Uncharacterized protein n=1 Tax=Aerophobetes bacterium TaxID=2030807 RepID=A0A2A4YG55_UNCAE|nr:MAG: hypothetical protein COB11_05285 [Candidatus Aerophobetes bacterium]
MAAITPTDFVGLPEIYSDSEPDPTIETMISHEMEKLDITDTSSIDEVAKKVLRVVWFPTENHSEVGIDDEMIYYIGPNPSHGIRSVEEAIKKSEKTPVVLITIAITSGNFEKMKKDLAKHPVSKLNTCMGSVAEIVNRYAEVRIPPFISQGPSASGLYLMARESYSPDKVKIDLHGITKEEIFTQCRKNCFEEAIGFTAFIWILYTLITSLVM